MAQKRGSQMHIGTKIVLAVSAVLALLSIWGLSRKKRGEGDENGN